MAALIIALCVGTVVAAVYITLAAQGFFKVRRELLAIPVDKAMATHDPPLVDERQTSGFTWKASGGVIASTTLLVLISNVAWAWYIMPFLAICSSVAVIVAFVFDRRENTGPVG